MATTPGGLPYPVGTDKVVDGDNQIRALAEAVEARTAAPRYREFTLGRQAIPTGATLYALVVTPGYTAPISFGFTYNAVDITFTLPDIGQYLITATVYIDWSNAGQGAVLRLSQKSAPANDFLAQNAFGMGQVATIATMVRVPAAATFMLAGSHNAGSNMNLAGYMRIMKYGT